MFPVPSKPLFATGTEPSAGVPDSDKSTVSDIEDDNYCEYEYEFGVFPTVFIRKKPVVPQEDPYWKALPTRVGYLPYNPYWKPYNPNSNVLIKKEGILPVDSHQDDIVVQSIEYNPGEEVAGVDSYLQQLAWCPTYDNPRSDFGNYAGNEYPEQQAVLNEYRFVPPATSKLKPGINYAALPMEAHEWRWANFGTNNHHIKIVDTINPQIALLIVRIAEKNLPFMDWTSAIDHIPNMLPTDPFPNPADLRWDKQKFLDHHNGAFRLIHVVIVDFYYEDGRHCIGFYTGYPEHPNTMVFTPTSGNDFVKFGVRQLLDDEPENQQRLLGKETVDWALHARMVNLLWYECMQVSSRRRPEQLLAPWKGDNKRAWIRQCAIRLE